MTSEQFRTNPMFLRNQFKGDGIFEIPKIEKEEIPLENIKLIGYDKLNEKANDSIVHFFLDDYKFEAMWNNPEPRIERLKKFKAVLTPNFGTYTEMPLSLKVYNTFKSRWCGAYLQSKGIKVIPTVAWGEPNTFWFCFDGIEKGCVVAVSTLGVRKEKALFMQGYNELLRKIKPKAVICYGKPFEEMQGNIIAIDYAKTNNLNTKNIEHTYIKKASGYVHCDKGMGSAFGGTSNSKIISKIAKNDLAKHVFSSYNNYAKNGWKGIYKGQTPGTKAGSKWNNIPPELPQLNAKGDRITYREFDVNNKIQDALRDAERFVVGDEGRIYYTPDHYATFFEIID